MQHNVDGKHGSEIQGLSHPSSFNRSLFQVVHVRNIPPDLVDVELMQLCIQYGTVSNYMMLKGKSQVGDISEIRCHSISNVLGVC